MRSSVPLTRSRWNSTVEIRNVKKKTKKGGKKAPSRDEVVLKLRSDPRTEKRFEPKSSPSAILSVLAFSVAAVLVGAGTYGQWLRDEALGPHKAASRAPRAAFRSTSIGSRAWAPMAGRWRGRRVATALKPSRPNKRWGEHKAA